MDIDADASRMEKAEAEGWHRLGNYVRDARNEIGYSNREDFAAAANVSVRVVADLEAGSRSNFSERILSRIESGIGWPAGTIDQVVLDPKFTPPKAAIGGDLLFRPPTFDRQPVQVEVGAVEKTIGLLTEISRERASRKKPPTKSDAEQRVCAAAVALCWPYVIRLVEDNCLPGNELHPSVRPLYEAFLAVQAEYAPEDTSGRYAQWLAGDMTDATDQMKRRYMERWSESRRARPSRRSLDTDD